jgi:amino acid adenylation domain-containing protein
MLEEPLVAVLAEKSPYLEREQDRSITVAEVFNQRMSTTYIELKEPQLANLEDIYPLSPMQQGMLFHTIYSPDSGLYFEQSLFTIKGDLDISAFAGAWRSVVERYSILRTSFLWEGLAKPMQVVHGRVRLPFEEQDWSHLSAEYQETQLSKYVAEDRARGFELTTAPLIRLALFKLSEDHHRFVFSRHHLLLDRWSRSLLLKEVFDFYEALSKGEKFLPQPSRPYGDYIAWLAGQDPRAAERYWRSTLAGLAGPTALSSDRKVSHSVAKDTAYGDERIQLSEKSTESVKSFAREQRLTLNVLAQGAWALLSSRYRDVDDVVFGVTVAGRPASLPGVESMVGLFINTLPLRVRVPANAKVLSWLQGLQEQQSTLQRYEYSSLLEIQGWSDVPRGVPLFESIFVFENLPGGRTFQTSNGELEFQSDRGLGSNTGYPLTVLVSPGSRLTIELVYDRARFDNETIRGMLAHFQTLLESLSLSFNQAISSVPILTDSERQRILNEWNNPRASGTQDSFLRLFETQVERTPDAPAVDFLGQRLSYRELNAHANQLAFCLRGMRIGPDDRVGVCIDRSPGMAVAVLGALKAGAAYVPLDPAYPSERLSFMLKDAQCAVLLTNERVSRSLPDSGVSVLCLDRDWSRLARESSENPETRVLEENLAYVIYTSGSTGWPRGVAMTHGALGNLISWQIANSFAPARTLQFASLSFDVSFQEMFSTWCSGGTLVLVSEELRHEELAMLRFLGANKVERIFVPFVYLQHLAEACADASADSGLLPVHLRQIITAGEQLEITPQISQLCNRLKDCTLYNHYGPSETHVVTAHTLSGAADDWPRLPSIGRPIANTQIYILDQSGELSPIGVAGELCIGGANVSRGYLDRPELTADKFVPNYFSSEPGGRIYCTGDLARYASSGAIEFLGRIDSQVKIRGYRIELGEIETAINGHAGVRETVVIARKDEPGDKRLVAYVVPRLKDSAVDAGANEGAQAEELAGTLITELRRLLREKLPEHMMPSAFVLLEAVPLNANGKLNRRVLPEPRQSLPELESDHVAPRTLTEELLAEIWAEVLKLEQIGVNDDFFQLGGHSLLATQVISSVRERFRIELPLHYLFEFSTVAGLASAVDDFARTATATAPSIITRDPDRRAEGLLATIDELSDEQVEALLGETLAENARS